MNCKEFRHHVADLFDKEVSPQTKARLERHMAGCTECRHYYEELSAAADLLRPRSLPQGLGVSGEGLEVRVKAGAANNPNPSPLTPNQVTPPLGGDGGGYPYFPLRRRRRVAAVFGGIVLAAGLAASAIHFTQSRSAQVGQKRAEPVHFTQVRLDSILTVVAGHYGKAVTFRDETSRQMQLIMTWDPDAPLDDFVRRLNAFDGLSLTMQHDTLFVEANSEDEK